MGAELSKNRISLLAVSACLLVFLAVSCRRAGPPPVVDGAGIKAAPVTARLHYFFDKTLSMEGFAKKGAASEYIKALPALWEAAGGAFPSLMPDLHYYAYVDTVSEFKSPEAVTRIKRELFQQSFYNGSAPAGGGISEVYRRGDEQPFTAVAEYSKTLYEQPDSAVIIVTDLYEQNREDPFSAFFRDAFSRGLSCAFFAVESSFAGKIYSVSRVNTGTREISVSDGTSTFFICIAGDSGVVSSYCAALSKELRRNNIFFNDAVFMVAQGETVKPGVSQPVPANKKEFANPKNAVRSMNIDREDLGNNVQSYRLLKFDSSRWAAGLALSNINHTNFTYSPSFELFLWGKQSKDGSNGWRQLSDSGNVSVKTERGSKIPLYIVADTKNKSLSPGYYKVKYKIIPRAKTTPEWVADLDAPDIRALEESAASSGAGVKVLQVKNVYEKIAEAFNNVTSKTMYANELYLIKR